MFFAELYRFANTTLTGDFVSVQALADKIVSDHPPIEKVEFWPVELDSNVSLGHMKYERERTSPYEDPFTVASIRFDRKQNRCWSRFICCKELMHVFDDEDEVVNTRGRFVQLLNEWQTRPLRADMSQMFSSEWDAEWMALLVLCPERLRNQWRAQVLAKTEPDYDVALSLRIPEIFIQPIMTDYYDRALARLTA